MSTILCDQCHSFPAQSIDYDAQTWCSPCWNRVAAHSAETGILAPCVLDIAFFRTMLAAGLYRTPQARIVFGPVVAQIERCAQRLGLPAP